MVSSESLILRAGMLKVYVVDVNVFPAPLVNLALLTEATIIKSNSIGR